MTWQVVDWTGAVAMALAGVLGIGAWAASKGEPRRVFWLLAGAGFVLLAVDELRSVHERVGRWLGGEGVPKPPGVNHMDDVVLLAYGLAGLVVCAVYWREVARPGVATPFLLGFAALAVSIGIDALAPVEGAWPKVEEMIETGGTLLFLVGFWRRYAEVAVVRARLTRPLSEPGRARTD